MQMSLTKAWNDAVRAKDWKAVGATYAEDAILLPPDSKEVAGRANIQAFFASFPPLTDVAANLVEIEVLGDMAYVRGQYKMTIHPPDRAAIADSGKYIEIRKRTADGSWKIFRDMFSSNAPLGK
jgi:uncharacterized protein (TIGR02246 family)